jgi:hypothetical protein
MPRMTQPAPPPPLHFGTTRITRGRAGIGIVLCAWLLISALLLAEGAPAEALLAVTTVALLVAALCAITRTVAIDPERRQVAVTHHLVGLRLTRRMPTDRFQRIEVLGTLFRRRYHWSDGTPEGDQKLMHYTLRLRSAGWRRVQLDHLHDLDAAEAMAGRLGALLGLPAERRGYRVTTNQAGRRLAVPDPRARENL